MADTATTLTVPSQFALIGQPAKPGPADKIAARAYQIVLQNELPTSWASNKTAQTNHFTGAVRLAIKPYLDAIGSARIRVLEKKQRVTKAVGGGHYSRDDEYEPIDSDHPLAHIVEHPGGEGGVWSMQQECAYLTLQHLLTGDAPVWTPVNEDGKPCQMFALTAATVQAMQTVGSEMYPNGAYRVLPYVGGSTFYIGNGLATSAILPGEQVRFFRQFHPWARNWGMSALESGALEVDILEAISRSRWSYFDQGLQLDCVVYLPGATGDEARAVQEQLIQRQGGARNSRKVLVVAGAGALGADGKPVSVQQLGPGARELDFNSSFEQSAGFVLAFFSVPKALVNLTETGGSYQSVWATRQMFYDLGLQPYAGCLSNFLTQALAVPWSEFPGQYKIEVEIPQPENIETDNNNWLAGVDKGLFTHNQSLRRLNLPTVGPEGDVPTPIYMAKLQQAVQPPPGAPGSGPQQPGDQMPPDRQMAPDGAESAPGDEQGAQDAITQAALESLGLGGDPVQKAAGPLKPTKPGGRQVRREGEKWQGSGGQWYAKKNGKTVAIGDPNKQRTAAQPAQAAGAKPAGGQLLDVRAAIQEHGGESDKAFDALRSKISRHLAGGGKASFWVDGKQVPVSKVKGGKVYDEKGAPVGMMPLAAGLPGTKSGIELHAPEAPQQAAPAPKRRLSPDQQRMYEQFSRAKSPRLREYGKRMLSGDDPHVAAAQKLPQTPAVQQAAQSAPQWAAKAAEKHADAVAEHFGISREQAHRLLTRAIAAVGEHAAQGVTIRDKRTGRTATLTKKALDPSKEWFDPAPYGYCPECREPGVCCERRLNGNAHCPNGHVYPRAKAKYACAMVTLTGATAKAIRALGRQVADEDLGEDGREADPHVTARCGLHADGPAAVAEAVRGFGPVALRLGDIGAFRGAESGKPYDVLYVEVDSPDLHRLHAALGELPHTDTHPEYRPHATIAYVKAGLADKYLAALQPLDAEEQITELDFSTAQREHTSIPLAEQKAMSAIDDSAGGFLVPPAGAKRKRRLKRRKMCALVADALKSFEG